MNPPFARRFNRNAALFAGFMAVLGVWIKPVWAAPMASLFTYQASLSESGGPANGTYDLIFRLYDSATNGTQIGDAFTNQAVIVTNGLLTVSLDFGAASFNGQPRWLEISVRKDTNAPYTMLAPRQPVTTTPYALTAGALASPLPPELLPADVPRLGTNQLFSGANIFAGPTTLTNGANIFGGSFAGDASGLTNLNSTAIRRLLITPISSAGTNFIVDFSADTVQTVASTNVNFLQSMNRPASGYYTECVWYIQGGATNRLQIGRASCRER